MTPPLHQRLLLDTPLAPADTQLLLATSRVLRQAVRDGSVQPLLRGKHIAIVAADPPDARGCAELEAAASALGARVSRLPPDAALAARATDEARDTLRMLARLYDAVAFDGVDALAAAELQRALDRPVLAAGLGRMPALAPMQAALAADAQASDHDCRFVLQALLLHSLGR